MKKVGLAVICLAILLNGCASGRGDADAGSDPGDDLYSFWNPNAGRVTPLPPVFQ